MWRGFLKKFSILLSYRKENMIKDKQKQLNQLQVLFDGIVIALAYFLAWYLAIENPIFPEGHGVLSPKVYFTALLPLIPGYLILYWIFGLYHPMRTMRMKNVLFRIIQANSVGLLLSASLFFAFPSSRKKKKLSARKKHRKKAIPILFLKNFLLMLIQPSLSIKYHKTYLFSIA